MRTWDVGIIGGGIHGASAAFHLSNRGVKTILFERRTAASGPTGRSSAICRAYYTNPFLARVARDSIRMFERFEELTGVDASYRRTGLYYLHPAEDLHGARASVTRLNELGVVTELLEGKELSGNLPGFDLDGVAAAAHE